MALAAAATLLGGVVLGTDAAKSVVSDVKAVGNVVSKIGKGVSDVWNWLSNDDDDPVADTIAGICAQHANSMNIANNMVGGKPSLPTDKASWANMTRKEARDKLSTAMDSLQTQTSTYVKNISGKDSTKANNTVDAAAVRVANNAEFLETMSRPTAIGTLPTQTLDEATVNSAIAKRYTSKWLSFLNALLAVPSVLMTDLTAVEHCSVNLETVAFGPSIIPDANYSGAPESQLDPKGWCVGLAENTPDGLQIDLVDDAFVCAYAFDNPEGSVLASEGFSVARAQKYVNAQAAWSALTANQGNAQAITGTILGSYAKTRYVSDGQTSSGDEQTAYNIPNGEVFAGSVNFVVPGYANRTVTLPWYGTDLSVASETVWNLPGYLSMPVVHDTTRTDVSTSKVCIEEEVVLYTGHRQNGGAADAIAADTAAEASEFRAKLSRFNPVTMMTVCMKFVGVKQSELKDYLSTGGARKFQVMDIEMYEMSPLTSYQYIFTNTGGTGVPWLVTQMGLVEYRGHSHKEVEYSTSDGVAWLTIANPTTILNQSRAAPPAIDLQCYGLFANTSIVNPGQSAVAESFGMLQARTASRGNLQTRAELSYTQRITPGTDGVVSGMVLSEDGVFEWDELTSDFVEYAGRLQLTGMAINSTLEASAPLGIGTANNYVHAIIPKYPVYRTFIDAYAKTKGITIKETPAQFAISDKSYIFDSKRELIEDMLEFAKNPMWLSLAPDVSV